MSYPLIVFLFQFLHFSQASLVMKEMNSDTHSCTVYFASFAILALSGRAFFMILPMFAMGRNLEQLAEFLNIPRNTCLAFLAITQTTNIIQFIQSRSKMENDPPEQQKPNYIHIYPFRFVEPYPHVYRTFAKGRWIGMEILAILIKQFKAYPPEYYEKAIDEGRITVNNNKVDLKYIVKHGDQIIHTSVRTQPPVLDLPIDIVHEGEQYVVVNKPASITVHTGGGHHFNTIQGLLTYQMGYKNLHVLHRLDKCTSGLLIFAKNKEKVALFHEESGNQIMKKMYFARVNGRVTWEHKELSAIIRCVSHKDGVYTVDKEIQQPLIIQKKQALQRNEVQQKEKEKAQNSEKKQEASVHIKKKKKNQEPSSDLKDSKTVFRRIWYDQQTDSSLLECFPITGRTHQIRVHLQYLGHPILNDIVYGGRFVGNGIIKFIQNKQLEQLKQRQYDIPRKKIKRNQQLQSQQWDYITRPWEIMLHSYRYKFGGKQFTTKLPYWFQKEAITKEKIIEYKKQ